MELERALLERARAGDRDAFARLATTHREAVYSAAWWVLADREAALDATQEALLKAFRHIDRFEGRSSFKTWVRRIATNVAIDRRGRRRVEGAGESEEIDPADPRDPRGDAPAEDVERRERRALVREAIDGLPPAQRAAVLLRDVEGRSYAEIAEELGVPKGTVMSRIHAGRTNLRERLAGVLGPRAEEKRLARASEGAS